MPHPSAHASRNVSIEALRIVAVAGIAVFHTFQQWFAQYASGSFSPETFAPVAQQPLVAFALGIISLLGAYGNHVFYMVSGYFLIPSAARASQAPPYWKPCARRALARCAPLVASVAFYALLALAVDLWVADIPGVSPSQSSWLVAGLEFVWVYLALVLLVPLIGWTWQRIPHHLAAVAAALCAVYALNAYIAFVSPGDTTRNLFEWRKLMSAVTYAGTFVAGAALRELVDRIGSTGDTATARFGMRALGGAVALACIAELVASMPGNASLIVTLSYKSTSLLAFLLAAGSLAFAATRPAQHPCEGAAARAQSVLLTATGSTLGFYIAQSVTSGLWRPAFAELLASTLSIGEPAIAALAFLVAGACVSVLLATGLLAFDALARRPLFRLLGLA